MTLIDIAVLITFIFVVAIIVIFVKGVIIAKKDIVSDIEGDKEEDNSLVRGTSVEEEVRKGNRIVAIKLYRQETGADLSEAIEYIDRLEVLLKYRSDVVKFEDLHDRKDICIKENMTDEEFDRFCANLLQNSGIEKGNKVAAIKLLRQETGINIVEAKKYVEEIGFFSAQEIGNGKKTIYDVDGMEGHEFEYFCAELLRENDFVDVEVTRGSGDQGVDIIASKDGIRYAVQCKNYATPLGNTPVQEVEAGRQFYRCHVGVVLTNSTFTPGAVALAEATRVLLWDRGVLQSFMEKGKKNNTL